MCGNLLSAAASSYSYGINGEDAWGCEVSALLQDSGPSIRLLQHHRAADARPASSASMPSALGPNARRSTSRPFDTFANHVEKNGDFGKRLVVKMDVEGVRMAIAGRRAGSRAQRDRPDGGGVSRGRDRLVPRHRPNRLSDFFYVAHVHQNNYLCQPGFDPFPGQVFEVLFVNKRIAVADPWVNARGPSPLDAPNAPALPDCQASKGGNELQRIGRWAAATRARVGVVVAAPRDLLTRTSASLLAASQGRDTHHTTAVKGTCLADPFVDPRLSRAPYLTITKKEGHRGNSWKKRRHARRRSLCH